MTRLRERGPGGTKGVNAATSDSIFVRSILDTSHEAFVSIDADGSIVDWNRAAEQTFGFRREEVVGRDLADAIIPLRYRQSHRDGLQRLLDGGDSAIVNARREFSAVHREGHEFPIEITIACVRVEGGGRDSVQFHAFMHDISERKLAEQVLRAMQSVTQAMARADTPQEAMKAVLATLGADMGWDVGAYWAVSDDGTLRLMAGWTGRDVEITEIDQLGRRLSPGEGLPGRALQRREPLWTPDFGAESAFAPGQAACRAGLRAGICVPVSRGGEIVGVMEFLASELRVRDPSIATAVGSVSGQIGELIGILEHRHALHKSLERLALTDQLTGLPNRRAWEEGLARELSRARRETHPVCVAVIDLDGFKSYNDRLGHLAGDALLTETAHAWRAQVRAEDLLARYGGDEFAAIIPAWALDSAVAVIERLRTATPAGQTCSAGVAGWNQRESALELFGRADAALYAAKQAGRNRTVAAEASSS
jgi:diguanylate cyclase (GGDEF)-like protein/PAS domain S-box-containing protein